MRYDVFISYSSRDQKIAEGVCAYLEQHGIRCFVAYRDIPRGVVWAGAIVDALEHSQMMLVLFSKHFNDSRQVDREIELAAEQGMPILTFRLSEDDFTGAKKYYLKNLNWIDAFPNPEHYFGPLKDNVCRLLGRRERGVSEEDIPVNEVTEKMTFFDTPKEISPFWIFMISISGTILILGFSLLFNIDWVPTNVNIYVMFIFWIILWALGAFICKKNRIIGLLMSCLPSLHILWYML